LSTPTLLAGRKGTTPKHVSMQSSTDAASVVAALDTALAG
jgi:hypothetical protein